MRKSNQRDLAVNQVSIGQVLGQLSAASFRLGADASINDVWLSVNFDDSDFEEAVVMDGEGGLRTGRQGDTSARVIVE